MLDLVLKQAGESEPGFARKTVKWAITATAGGRYTGVVTLGDGKGRAFDSCPNLSQPELVGGPEPRTQFLTASLSTVVLFLKDKAGTKDQEQSAAKHNWFVNLLRQGTGAAPYLDAAANLLADANVLTLIQADLKQAKAKPTENAVVVVDGINPLERNDWSDWWRMFRTTLRKQPKKKKTGLMRCLITGECISPALTHPIKIAGLPGDGKFTLGDAIVSFDKESSQSYGLQQSANAAMSVETATAYAATLNLMIEQKSVKLGNMQSVYWFSNQDEISDEDNVMSFFSEPPAQTAGSAELRAHELLTAIRNGERPDLAGSRFVALMLSGRTSRVMVREVMQGSFEELATHTETWFHDLAIVARDGKGLAHDPKFLTVAGSLVRDLKDIPSPWLQQLWRAAVTGGRIPAATLAQALARARLDFVQKDDEGEARDRSLRFSQRQTRMALIKAYFIRNRGDKDMQPHSNPDHPHPAYHCGRALAVFARLQRAALGDVGAGVVQRFYTAASQTPGLIFGRLASNAKNHLSKLDGGLAWWYEGQLADVMIRIKDVIPRTLTLEEQSLFALGYYQQLAEFRAGKKGLPEGETDETSQSNQPD